jgi:hypothetical protein
MLLISLVSDQDRRIGQMREGESIYCLDHSLGSGSAKQKRNAV